MKDDIKLVDAIVWRICSGQDMQYNPVCFFGARADTERVAERLVTAYQTLKPDEQMKITTGSDFIEELTRSFWSRSSVDYVNGGFENDPLI